MKSKILQYILICLVSACSFWFYFQLTTYPYKVARWFQPLEASVISAVAKHCSPSSAWLDLLVDHAVTYQGAYSAQAVYLTPQKTQSTCEIGYKDGFLGSQVNAMHRYRYASTSKLITTAITLKLIKEKKINLQSRLVSFFPELEQLKDERIAQITIANLLNHSAGFNRMTLNGDPMFLRSGKPWCPNNVMQMQSLLLEFAPGEKQIYSNLGYCLLGEVISRVNRKNYREYVEQELFLAKYGIKFANNYYEDDEVRYDYRYEDWFNDTYLKLFDFEAISSVAGLSGSASALANLLWDIHHDQNGSPFIEKKSEEGCTLKKVGSCLRFGVFHYQPYKYGITLHFHEGYLPGVASVAVIDSYGGITVLVKSGANRYQSNPQNDWIPWIYNRLNLYYLFQGEVPLLNRFNKKYTEASIITL